MAASLSHEYTLVTMKSTLQPWQAAKKRSHLHRNHNGEHDEVLTAGTSAKLKGNIEGMQAFLQHMQERSHACCIAECEH